MATKKRTKNTGQGSLFVAPETPDAFRKAVQILHSKPKRPMGLMERKIADNWLKRASREDPDTKGWWTVHISEMAQEIGFDSNNSEYLKKAAGELMQIVFEWDVIASQEKRITWKASVLFPEVEIENTLLRFQVSSQLLAQVRNPAVYAFIDESISRRFRRGPTFAIYQHCFRFVKVGKTSEVKWETFRDMILGESAGASSYSEYKYFKAKVLKPAIAEINSVSDIEVDLLEIRAGKWLDSLKFEVRQKVQKLEMAKDDVLNLPVLGEMIKLGVPQSEARKLLQEHGADAVAAAIAFTSRRKGDNRSAKLENPAAYFRQALQKGWAQAEDVVAKKPGASTKARDGNAELRTAYWAQQDIESQRYFKELDLPDQTSAMERYNAQQETASLKIKPSKPTKGALVAFYRWLGRDVWGEPTDAELVTFAGQLLATRN